MPETSTSEVYAIKALARGEASKAQQIKALNYIIQDLAGLEAPTFVPGAPEGLILYLEGRRSVAMALRHILTITSKDIRTAHERHDRSKQPRRRSHTGGREAPIVDPGPFTGD